jgi:hypothetical protein
MKLLTFTLGLTMLGSSPALSQTNKDQTLVFGCNDLVIVGKLKNVDYHASDDPEDILGHGWVDATLSVRRVVRGGKTRSKLPVRYFAHSYMRDDRDVMLVLAPQPGGVPVVRRGQLMSAHPKLAAHCE